MRKLLIALLPLLLLGQSGPKGKMVVLLIGPPGSGKTTQAKKLGSAYHIPAISMADILKNEGGWKKNKLDSRGLKVGVASGDLVNEDVANGLVADRISQKDALRGFILDGYPTTHKQAEFLEAQLKERGLPAPLVLVLDVPDAVALERMSERRRIDDTPDVMQRRLADYHKESQAVLDRYRGGKQLRRVDGTLKPQEVWQQIERALREPAAEPRP